jgi:hypothetical protein
VLTHSPVAHLYLNQRLQPHLFNLSDFPPYQTDREFIDFTTTEAHQKGKDKSLWSKLPELFSSVGGHTFLKQVLRFQMLHPCVPQQAHRQHCHVFVSLCWDRYLSAKWAIQEDEIRHQRPGPEQFCTITHWTPESSWRCGWPKLFRFHPHLTWSPLAPAAFSHG